MKLIDCLRHKGVQCVFGGFLIQFVLGSLYCWGIITTAVTSHLRKYDGSVTYNQTLKVYAIALGCQGMTMFLGGVIESKIGARKTSMLGGYILVLGTISASFATSLTALYLTYGVLFGIGIGITYTAPIACSTRWFPPHKGLVTGIIVGGFGGGSFLFGLLATFLLNPDAGSNHQEELVNGYFPPNSDVANRVPFMFAVLGCCYFAFITTGAFMMTECPHYNRVEQKGGKKLNLRCIDNGCNGKNGSQIGSTESGIFAEKASGGQMVRQGQQGVYQSAPLKEEIGKMDDDVPFPATATENGENPGEEVEIQFSPLQVNVESAVRAPSKKMPRGKHGFSSIPQVDSDNNDENCVGNLAAGAATTSLNRGASNDDNMTMESSVDREGNVEAIDGHASMQQHKEHSLYEYSPWEVLRSGLGWHVASCFVFTTVAGMFLAGTYKTYALESFPRDEVFLSEMGSLAAIFNAVGRIFWGMLGDRFGHLETLTCLAISFTVIIVTYPFTTLVGVDLFVLWTFAVFLCEGGNFALYMPLMVQLFGFKNAGSNYGLVFTAFSAFNFVNLIVMASAEVGFLSGALSMAAVTFVGFLDLLTLRYHIAYSTLRSTELTSTKQIEIGDEQI